MMNKQEDFIESNLELMTIKALLTKEFYRKNSKYIDKNTYSEECRELFKALDRAHESTTKDINTDILFEFYSLQRTATTARKDLIKQILARVDTYDQPDDEAMITLLKSNKERAANRKIADMATLAMVGDKYKLQDIKDYINSVDIYSEKSYELAMNNLEEAIEMLEQKGEFRFTNGLEFISQHTDGLSMSRGNLVIIFASSNAGKSTFVAQMDVGFLHQGYKVAYFCNEEPAHKILVNHYRTHFGVNDKTLSTYRKHKVEEFDNFFLVPAHGMTLKEIDSAVKDIKPDIIVLDQADKVLSSGYRDEARHTMLENLYDSIRIMAAKYNSLVINVTQANDQATGQLNMNQNMTASARIGKSTNADLVLGIGMKSVDNPIRAINICKNKINGLHETIVCNLDAPIARFTE